MSVHVFIYIHIYKQVDVQWISDHAWLTLVLVVLSFFINASKQYHTHNILCFTCIWKNVNDYICIYLHSSEYIHIHAYTICRIPQSCCGVATISRLLRIIGFFCRLLSLL